jgi:hypothetical protein
LHQTIGRKLELATSFERSVGLDAFPSREDEHVPKVARSLLRQNSAKRVMVVFGARIYIASVDNDDGRTEKRTY